MSDTSDTDIPVWVDGMVKYVTGLTRRTTCDDVTYALMEQEMRGDVDLSAYAIFERWCGVERPLKGRTKILKVWRAWGDEQDNVVLTLRRLSEMFRFASCESLRSKRLRKPQSRDRERAERRRERYEHKHHLAAVRDNAHHQHRHSRRKDVLTASRLYESRDPRARDALSREVNNNTKQCSNATNRKHSSKESLSYAYGTSRDLDKNRCSKNRNPGSYDDENNNKRVAASRRHHDDEEHAQSRVLQEMMQLILTQQQQLQEQLHRAQEVDVQIDHYEHKLHQIRMRENGRDYVQKAYIRDLSGSEEGSSISSSGGSEERAELQKTADLQAVLFSQSAAEMAAGLSGRDLEEYLNIADELLALEDRLSLKEQAIQHLSVRIDEEIQPHTSQYNESSLLVSPPSIHAGMVPLEIFQKAERRHLPSIGGEELDDAKCRLRHMDCLSRTQQQQIDQLEYQITGYDVKLDAMKEYAVRLTQELDGAMSGDVCQQGADETTEDVLDESIQMTADPRTSTPYVSGKARSNNFVDDFLASPKLKSPSLHQCGPTPQNPYTPYNIPDEKGAQASHSSRAVSSSDDSTRFSLDSREFTSTSEESGTTSHNHADVDNTSRVDAEKDNATSPIYEEFQFTRHSYAQMEMISSKDESTLDYDSNSDTGLSSLHSDDAVPILETLV